MKIRLKYWIYQMRCKMKGTVAIDPIDFAFRTLFYREGVRV